MTIASSGPLTMTAINTEFGYGLNLNAYRSQAYWTDAGGRGNFGSSPISMSEFYSKRIPKSFSYNSYQATGTGTSTRTFAGMSFGAAATTRRIIAVFGASDNTNLVASSVTIGGISAPIAIQDNEGGNSTNPFVCIAYATVPTGTSGSVVIALNGSPSTIYCATYSLYNTVTQTPQATAFDVNGSTQTVSLNIPANGFAVAVSTQISKTSSTWVGVTERADLGGSNAYSWGDTQFITTAQSPRTIQQTNGSSDNGCSISACWY